MEISPFDVNDRFFSALFCSAISISTVSSHGRKYSREASGYYECIERIEYKK